MIKELCLTYTRVRNDDAQSLHRFWDEKGSDWPFFQDFIGIMRNSRMVVRQIDGCELAQLATDIVRFELGISLYRRYVVLWIYISEYEEILMN